jgi:hypothetical protein
VSSLSLEAASSFLRDFLDITIKILHHAEEVKGGYSAEASRASALTHRTKREIRFAITEEFAPQLYGCPSSLSCSLASRRFRGTLAAM